MTRTIKIPDATHPITIRPTSSRVTVRVDGTVVAETDNALSLAEASYPVAQYIPLTDVDQSLLERTTTQTYCPYKGDASYYTVNAPDGSSTGAAGPSLTISPAFVKVIASNVAPAAAVAPGKKTSLALTLQNQGNVPAMGTSSMTIAASVDPSGAGGTMLATVPLRVKLKTGASGHYKVKFTVPASLPAGRYYLAVQLNVAALGDDTAADGLAVSASTLTVT